MFFTFGIPLAVVGGYFQFAAKIKDKQIFIAGLISTIHFACWIGLFLAFVLWRGPDASFTNVVFLMIVYLVTIAPAVAVALWISIWIDRKRLTDFGFAMISNLTYFLLFGVIPWGAMLMLGVLAVLFRGASY